MKKTIIALIILLTLIFIPSLALARENVDYWYIKNFDSEIIVNQDSSVTITEKITADCGECINKHGIFRTLPTRVYSAKNIPINTPIRIISITDFNNHPYQYQTIKNRLDHTLTWKIGDPNKTVQGENYYQIKYQVQNAIRVLQDKNEFYWNLNGNFWDIETDNFNGKIIFPQEINQTNSEINLYSGVFGQKDENLAQYSWDKINVNILNVFSTKTLKVGEGITISAVTPKIFTAYQPPFLEKYGAYFSFLLPIIIFILCYLLWSKFGRDPKINPTIAPEFSTPDNLPPMEIGAVLSDGAFKTNYITAGIVNLAVKGVLKIEKITPKGIFQKEDYELTLLENQKIELSPSEKILKDKLFNEKNKIKLSDQKNKFYTSIPAISQSVVRPLVKNKLLVSRSRTMQILFIVIAFIIFSLSFFGFIFSPFLALNVILSAIIIFIFSFLLRQRTREGAELLRKIKGFRLFIETAEKYRQKFNEKENIFEKFLPYAMVFGIAELWTQKMKIIYGEDYFNTYHPVWFYGAGIASFNADSFNSAINGLSSNMSSTLASSPSSSGSGGGGFSGGGGGGGGGGGW